jgi:hypothetical protein
MQITIKDSLIKSCLAEHVEVNLEKPNAKLTKEIFADPKFQKRLTKALEDYFNEEVDVISDAITDIKIPVLDKAIKDRFFTA